MDIEGSSPSLKPRSRMFQQYPAVKTGPGQARQAVVLMKKYGWNPPPITSPIAVAMAAPAVPSERRR